MTNQTHWSHAINSTEGYPLFLDCPSLNITAGDLESYHLPSVDGDLTSNHASRAEYALTLNHDQMQNFLSLLIDTAHKAGFDDGYEQACIDKDESYITEE